MKSRGSDLIVQQESTTDGIVIYHNQIQKYRYGGDMETYKTKLLQVIYSGYYTGYPGGPLDYLNKWKDTIIRYENIAPEEFTSSDSKRTTFGA